MSRNKGMGELWKSVQQVDRAAVRRRVAELKRDYPNASRDQLHKRLVYAKCLQAGTVGAVTGITSMVPVVGRVAGVVLGSLADATVVTTLQAELVAETFVLYDFELPEHAERMAVVAVAATNFGATAVSAEVARSVARQAGAWLGRGVARRALPIASIATSAASNVGVTYLVGMRAQALCTMRDQPVEDWGDLLRGVTSIDERKVMQWASSAASTAIEQIGSTATSMLSRLNALVEPVRNAVSSAANTRRSTTRPARSAAKKSGGAAKRGATRGAVKSGAVKSGAVKSGAVKSGAVKRGAAKRGAAKRGAASGGAASGGGTRGAAKRGTSSGGATQRSAATNAGASKRGTTKSVTSKRASPATTRSSPTQQGTKRAATKRASSSSDAAPRTNAAKRTGGARGGTTRARATRTDT